VASVKRTTQGIINNSLGPGTVTLSGHPLKIVLMEAFKVKSYQIVGPSWLDEDCFEIVAKMPEGSTSDQIPAMLQALLMERFKLAAHKDDRPRPANRLRQPVQDFTGLKGTYDIDLSWAPDPALERSGPYAGAFADAHPNADLPPSPPADLFTAIRESLGLRLEPRKEPVEVLVIDHIERVPTEN
jgi:hypothetical protein